MPALRELPADLWPRNRLVYAGPQAVSTAELLAILLGNGNQTASALDIATHILCTTGGIHELARLSHNELTQLPNIGHTKAATIRAAIEFARRLQTAPPPDRATIRNPADAFDLIGLEMGLLEQEELRVLMLDNKNKFIRQHTVYTGNINTVVIRLAEVFREPIRHNAASIVLAHNHPSGDPTPSPEDVRTTELAYEASQSLDLLLLDHIIIGRNQYVSLKERGLGFSARNTRYT